MKLENIIKKRTNKDILSSTKSKQDFKKSRNQLKISSIINRHNHIKDKKDLYNANKLDNIKREFDFLREKNKIDKAQIDNEIDILIHTNKNSIARNMPTKTAKTYKNTLLKMISSIISGVGIIQALQLCNININNLQDTIISVLTSLSIVILFFILSTSCYNHLENIYQVNLINFSQDNKKDVLIKFITYIPTFIFMFASIYTNYVFFEYLLQNKLFSLLFASLIDINIVRNCIVRYHFETFIDVDKNRLLDKNENQMISNDIKMISNDIKHNKTKIIEQLIHETKLGDAVTYNYKKHDFSSNYFYNYLNKHPRIRKMGNKYIKVA